MIDMNKLCFLLMLFLSVHVGLAQKHLMDSEMPKPVIKTFRTMFTNVADHLWTEYPDCYQVSFNGDGFMYEAYFSFDGNWLRTEYTIDSEEMPEIVVQKIREVFKSFDFGMIKKVELPEQKRIFKIELYDTDYNQRFLVYDDEGNPVN